MNDKIDKKLTGKGIFAANKWIRRIRSIWWIIGGLILLMAIGFWVFGEYGDTVVLPNKKTDTQEPDTAQLVLRQISHNATRDGKIEWSVNADDGWYDPKTRTTVLNHLEVVFFKEGAEDIRLTAKDGVLDNDTNNLKLGGEVKVEKEDVMLITRGASYDYETRIVKTLAPVEVTSSMFTLTGETGEMNMVDQHVQLKGRIHAKINNADVQ